MIHAREQRLGQLAAKSKGDIECPAANSVDIDLSFSSFLVQYGTEMPDGRMSERRVVDTFDVVEHV